MISQQQLLKQIRNPDSLNCVIKSFRYSQLKYSKAIYNNRQIRKVKLFLKQSEQFNRIQAMKADDARTNRIRTEGSTQKKKYDDNQLKELNFEINPTNHQYFSENKQLKTLEQIQDRKAGLKTRRKKAKLLPLIQTKGSSSDRNSISPRKQRFLIRPKSLSQYQKKQEMFNYSPIKLRKKAITIFQSKNLTNSKQIVFNQSEGRVSLKQNQMQSALRNFLQLIYNNNIPTYEYPIKQYEIDEKIRQYYNMNKKEIKNSKCSKFQHLFEFPHCQFVSLKQSRNSIDRIFNLSIKSAQRLAFKIFDRNGNGIIDQKDIIELLSQAELNQAMQKDLQVLIKNYYVNKSQVNVYSDSNQKKKMSMDSVNSNLNTIREFSDISEVSFRKKQPRAEKVEGKGNNMKFQKQKLFTFLQSKQHFYQSTHKKQKNVVCLNWQKFAKAFQGRRPKIFYDLLNFLFGCDSEFLIERNNPQKIRRNPNNEEDDYDNHQNNGTVRKKRETSHRSFSRMGSTIIGAMINKAKSIQKLDSIKYK